MALTTIKTGAISDDAVTEDKIANAINTARAANTAKDLTALSASNLTSGTIPDDRFPATLPAASAANLTAVPAANITGTLPAISGANLTNLPPNRVNRNLIINGAMQVAQRGTSATTSSSGYPVCDRWRVGAGGLDEAVTVAQSALTSSDTPYSSGFRYATKITNGNQTSGLGATDYLSFAQRLEGQNINSCNWDFTSTSSKLTVSFWIKSSVAQTFYSRFRITEASADKDYVFAVAATTSWQKITKTISGASGLNPKNGIDMGFFWDIILAYGTDYTGSMTVDQWNTVNTSAYVPDMTSTWYTTNDATFEITGVQLEVGSVATDFEYRSFGEELALCHRYYFKLGKLDYLSTHLPANHPYAIGMSDNDNENIYAMINFPVKMRTAPTALEQSGSASDYQVRRDTTQTCTSVPTFTNAAEHFCRVNFPRSSHGWGTGQMLWCMSAGSSGYLGFSAELG